MKDTKSLEESVNSFLSFFRSSVKEITNLKCPDSRAALFSKILYSSLLDALSITTAHPEKGNRDRIVEFIRTFCNWDNCERVSLPHLVRLLEKVPGPTFSNFREYAFSQFDKWTEGEVIYLDKDPTLESVKKHWKHNIPILKDIRIEFLQHVNLFYRYRNSVIHEWREPGYGIEFPRDSPPYYHSMTDTDTQQNSWQLVYPLRFYEKLCEAAIDNLKDYYLKNRIEPRSCYRFGTYWIEELNR